LGSSTGRPSSAARVIVVTGPSGAGKGTLIKALVDSLSELEVAVSATTRARRAGEVNGRDYWFLSEDDFRRRIAEGDFLEHVTYVSGHRYGTLRSEIDRIADAGKVCVLELETEGALAVEQTVPGAVTIFITAPLGELERRLRARATESAGEIEERVDLARRQLEQADAFSHVVVNDDRDRAAEELTGIVARELGVSSHAGKAGTAS
jgi:guanylate kinase